MFGILIKSHLTNCVINVTKINCRIITKTTLQSTNYDHTCISSKLRSHPHTLQITITPAYPPNYDLTCIPSKLRSHLHTFQIMTTPAYPPNYDHTCIHSNWITTIRIIPPEVFLEEGVLKICSKFTGEHPCRSRVSIKSLCRFWTKLSTSWKRLMTLYFLKESHRETNGLVSRQNL